VCVSNFVCVCVCVCLIVCVLETSTMKSPRPVLGCCATQKVCTIQFTSDNFAYPTEDHPISSSYTHYVYHLERLSTPEIIQSP
jgi:hypothetical protein